MTPEERAELERLRALEAAEAATAGPSAEADAEAAGEVAAEVGAATAETVGEVAATVAAVVGEAVNQAHAVVEGQLEQEAARARVEQAAAEIEAEQAQSALAGREADDAFRAGVELGEARAVEAVAEVFAEGDPETPAEAVAEVITDHGGAPAVADTPPLRARRHPWFRSLDEWRGR